MGKDDFTGTEANKIKFSIENWLFQIPRMGDARWLNRQELFRSTIRKQFMVLANGAINGRFSFKQTTKPFAKIQFGLSIVAVKKQTKYLEILYTSSFLSFVPDILGSSGKDAIKEFCHSWNMKTDEIVKPDNLMSCPCTLESAKMNPDLTIDFTCSATEPNCHENVNAHRCFLVSVNET